MFLSICSWSNPLFGPHLERKEATENGEVCQNNEWVNARAAAATKWATKNSRKSQKKMYFSCATHDPSQFRLSDRNLFSPNAAMKAAWERQYTAE